MLKLVACYFFIGSLSQPQLLFTCLWLSLQFYLPLVSALFKFILGNQCFKFYLSFLSAFFKFTLWNQCFKMLPVLVCLSFSKVQYSYGSKNPHKSICCQSASADFKPVPLCAGIFKFSLSHRHRQIMVYRVK